MKPFSGRAIQEDALSLRALDHGYYYDDPDLLVIVAPVRDVGREYRYVVADGEVVAGSAYSAARREAVPDDPTGASWRFAAQLAQALPPGARLRS